MQFQVNACTVVLALIISLPMYPIQLIDAIGSGTAFISNVIGNAASFAVNAAGNAATFAVNAIENTASFAVNTTAAGMRFITEDHPSLLAVILCLVILLVAPIRSAFVAILPEAKQAVVQVYVDVKGLGIGKAAVAIFVLLMASVFEVSLFKLKA
eukprot:TRINITY_DN20281_c0_g1_i1.p1 TRINITY_DN20281_c0_g1~~TRINITY_DN20281_c0_g1_i1.p1  ORF type:complete len:169 (-),score=36.71 TRINITY_DN20281_c0_g1_i1:40-504(-)